MEMDFGIQRGVLIVYYNIGEMRNCLVCPLSEIAIVRMLQKADDQAEVVIYMQKGAVSCPIEGSYQKSRDLMAALAVAL